MEIKHLWEFVAFCETMNFSLTARRLFMAKSTLLQHIRGMENELGFSVIDPSNPRALTEKGEAFLYRIQDLLAEYDDILEECREGENVVDAGAINVLCTPGDNCLPDIPQSIKLVNSMDLYVYDEFAATRMGKADLAINYSSKPNSPRIPEGVDASLYNIVPLQSVRCRFVMSKDHPLSRCARISDSPKRKWPLITASLPLYASGVRSIQEQLSASGIPFSPRHIRPESLVKTLLADAECLCIAYENSVQTLVGELVQGRITVRDFEDAPIVIYPFAVSLKDNPNPQLASFLNNLASASE